MILGLDHIALSASNLAQAAQNLAALGFETVFVCEDLPNPIEKERFLRRCEPVHDIGQYRGKTGAAFEITVHGPTIFAANSGFQPVCALEPTRTIAKPADGDAQTIAPCVAAAFALSAECMEIGASLADIWVTRAETSGLLGAVRTIPNLDAMQSFLTNGLGIRVGTQGEDAGHRWASFDLAGPVKQWNGKLLFVEASQSVEGPDHLDDAGCPCIALLSSDLTKDLERLSPFVGEAERFQLKVGPTDLDISLVRGPSGEIWELIDPRKKKRT